MIKETGKPNLDLIYEILWHHFLISSFHMRQRRKIGQSQYYTLQIIKILRYLIQLQNMIQIDLKNNIYQMQNYVIAHFSFFIFDMEQQIEIQENFLYFNKQFYLLKNIIELFICFLFAQSNYSSLCLSSVYHNEDFLLNSIVDKTFGSLSSLSSQDVKFIITINFTNSRLD
ncbi:unnamed protein product [Paramecium octaurelia]|uniref:Uncharacterized protein n=1 Tax=Paramecium octaurelia TaxID=43137 RepID=A0A8S1T7D9_PAROT|nr:unnamed protein product [Paramecium octaurelia]